MASHRLLCRYLKMHIFPEGARNELKLTACVCKLPQDITVRSGVILIDRLQSPCVSHVPAFFAPRLMDMPQSNIIIPQSRKLPCAKRDMPVVASVRQQDLISLPLLRKGMVIPALRYLSLMVTQPIDRQRQFRYLHNRQLPVKDHMDVCLPLEPSVVRIPFQIIMVPCDQDHLRLLKRPEEIVYFLQFPQKRLSVKKISRDQQKIRLFLVTDLHDLRQAVPDLPSPLFAVSVSGVRICPQMYVCDVYELHLLSFLPPPSSMAASR